MFVYGMAFVFKLQSLFIFPFLVGIVIYIYGSDIVENEILRANSVILQQNEQKIDAIVEKMKGIANQVSLSPSMQLAQDVYKRQHNNQGKVRLNFEKGVGGVQSADQRVTVLSLNPLQIEVDVSGARGRSISARFALKQ